jgi:hypothetical protein
VAWAVGTGLVAWRARRAAAPDRVATTAARPSWVVGAAPVAVLALVAVVVGATATGHGVNDRRRDELVFRFEARAADAVLAVIDRDRPVHIATRGSAAFLAISPSLAVALEDAGVDVRLETTDDLTVDEAQRGGYGPHRLELAPHPGARIHVVTGGDDLPEVPGRLVARFGLGLRADRIAAELAEQLSAGPLVPSDRADEVIAPYHGVARELVDYSIALLTDDPDSAVRSEVTLDLLRAGYLESPHVDPELLDAMDHELERGVEVWGDDRFEIVVELLP